MSNSTAIKIGNKDLTYRLREDATYEFVLPMGTFTFKAWKWGQKNSLVESCISFDTEKADFNLNMGKFNEIFLSTCMKEAIIAGQSMSIDQQAVQGLDAQTGDLLLDICSWVNFPDDGPLNWNRGKEVHKQALKGNWHSITAADHSFTVRPWTWGEKNLIMDQCTYLDKESGQAAVSPKGFNELMLMASVEEALHKGVKQEITLDYLRGLDAWIGDLLLEAANEMNEISASEKKSSDMT